MPSIGNPCFSFFWHIFSLAITKCTGLSQGSCSSSAGMKPPQTWGSLWVSPPSRELRCCGQGWALSALWGSSESYWVVGAGSSGTATGHGHAARLQQVGQLPASSPTSCPGVWDASGQSHGLIRNPEPYLGPRCPVAFGDITSPSIPSAGALGMSSQVWGWAEQCCGGAEPAGLGLTQGHCPDVGPCQVHPCPPALQHHQGLVRGPVVRKISHPCASRRCWGWGLSCRLGPGP